MGTSNRLNMYVILGPNICLWTFVMSKSRDFATERQGFKFQISKCNCNDSAPQSLAVTLISYCSQADVGLLYCLLHR